MRYFPQHIELFSKNMDTFFLLLRSLKGLGPKADVGGHCILVAFATLLVLYVYAGDEHRTTRDKRGYPHGARTASNILVAA